MIDEFASMLDGYDDVKPSQGMSSDPLDAGWYALEVVDVMERKVSKNGVPFIKMRLKVLEGPAKGRSAFVSQFMGASRFKSVGGHELERTPEEYAKAKENVQGAMKGLMKALERTTGSAIGEGAEKVFSFYNVDSWQGAKFIGRILLQAGVVNPATGAEYPPSNNLAEYHAYSDQKKGYAWYMSKHNATPGPVAVPLV